MRFGQALVERLKIAALPEEETQAASDLYQLAGQEAAGGDAIRAAGGIPLLLQLAAWGSDTNTLAAEHALGALAHMTMQRVCNHDEILAAGGLAVLTHLLHRHDQAAQYADSMLSVMVLSSQSAPLKQAVKQAVAALPAGTLRRYPELALLAGAAVESPVLERNELLDVSSQCCTICLDAMCPRAQTTCALACGHCYHGACIRDWLLRSTTCPDCRRPV